MARKIKVKLILQLRDALLTRSDIASTRHMSRHSVGKVFDIADLKGITYADVCDLDEDEVYRMFFSGQTRGRDHVCRPGLPACS